MLKADNIPYRVCDSIELQYVNNWVFYVAVNRGFCVKLHESSHLWLTSNNKDPYLYSRCAPLAKKLLEMKIIEPDLSKMCVGKMSLYVPPRTKKNIIEKVYLNNIYIENISTIDMLISNDYIEHINNLNLLFSDNQIPPKEFNGNIVINCFSNLKYLLNTKCNSIRIETSEIPTEYEIELLKKALLSNKIQIAISYFCDINICSLIINKLEHIKNNNLIFFFDTCMVYHSSGYDSMNEGHPKIPNISLKNIKISCGAGINSFYIDNLGNVYNCYRLKKQLPICNINNVTLKEFISYVSLNALPSRKMCDTCDIKYFCGKGCMAEWKDSSYPYCDNIKKILKKEFPDMYEQDVSYGFDVDILKEHKNLDMYEYMCERNAFRTLLLGYNIREPLLLMTCGLFIKDNDFLNTGKLNLQFFRNMINYSKLPLLDPISYNLDWDVIDIHLEKGLPVMLNIDVFFMPYKSYYNKTHATHSIVLLEKTTMGYLILDWYHPDYYYGEISQEILSLARLSTNEKTKISVFSGHPIQAAYRLVHINRFPKTIQIDRYIRNNLYSSIKTLTDNGGAISIFQNAKSKIPTWVENQNYECYQNAIESFFFLDLELKMLYEYWVKYVELHEDFYVSINKILIQIKEIQTLERELKNHLIISMKKNKAFGLEKWTSLIDNLSIKLYNYCESVIDIIRKIDEICLSDSEYDLFC